jgi:hypothetical protein
MDCNHREVSDKYYLAEDRENAPAKVMGTSSSPAFMPSVSMNKIGRIKRCGGCPEEKKIAGP